MLGIKMKTDSRAFVELSARRKGLLTVAAGDNVMRVLPPLVIEEAHIREFVERLCRRPRAEYEVPRGGVSGAGAAFVLDPRGALRDQPARGLRRADLTTRVPQAEYMDDAGFAAGGRRTGLRASPSEIGSRSGWTRAAAMPRSRARPTARSSSPTSWSGATLMRSAAPTRPDRGKVALVGTVRSDGFVAESFDAVRSPGGGEVAKPPSAGMVAPSGIAGARGRSFRRTLAKLLGR